ncbi:MAG: hypothetical protein HUJ25_12605 [Crocinitomicaceae bacterium]|nr:hypothetical protein [Crocinitomicaceae bacterium]
MHKQKLIVLIAAGVGIVGIILPWASANLGFFGNYSQNGFNSGWTGYATLASLAAAAGILFKESDNASAITAETRKIVAGAGVGAIIFPILFIIILKAQQGGQFVSLGFGVFLCLLAGIAIAVVPFAIKGDGSFEMPTKDSIKADLEADTSSSSPVESSSADVSESSDEGQDNPTS